MHLILPTDKLADTLLRNTSLIAAVERLGMELGMGDESIREACAKHRVDADFCTALLNALGTAGYYPEQPLSVQGAQHLVGYLQKTHEHYRRVQLRTVQAHVARLAASSPNPNKPLQLAEHAFGELHHELLRYFDEVEQQLFAHVRQLHDSALLHAAGQAQGAAEPAPVSFPALLQRFKRVTDKLQEICTLLVKYLSGSFDRALRNAVIRHLSAMEKDLRSYLNLQELLLLPALLNMRSALTNKRLEEIYRYTSQTVDLADGKALSEREREVLKMVAHGMSSGSIAKRLHLSLHTVQAHRKNIAAKLGIKSVPGLTTYAIMHGIVSPK
jgi:regulator of cell morphogenesis and NO signaling